MEGPSTVLTGFAASTKRSVFVWSNHRASCLVSSVIRRRDERVTQTTRHAPRHAPRGITTPPPSGSTMRITADAVSIAALYTASLLSP